MQKLACVQTRPGYAKIGIDHYWNLMPENTRRKKKGAKVTEEKVLD